MPVVSHTGDTYSAKAKRKFADPLTLDDVLVDHPSVRFVIAHAGNPWIESAAQVASKNANVWIEGSAFMIGGAASCTAVKQQQYVVTPMTWIRKFVEDPSMILFGTDWPLADAGSYLAAFKLAIPRKHWRAVFFENAVRVFNLDTIAMRAAAVRP